MDGEITWTVPQLNEWIGATIAQAVPDAIWIEGEIHNLTRSAAGHVYFTLIEAGADRRSADHTLSVSLFKWNKEKVNLQLKRAGGQVRMADGVRVRIRGDVELYTKRAQLQIKMISIDPVFTLGDLALRREELIARLRELGLLDANAARPLAMLPLRVALITSLGSAAHADFIDEITTSGHPFELLCIDARMQGVDAEQSVCAAVELAIEHAVELIAIVRGGGSATDLSAFDSEPIARCIGTSPVPVWVGLGHETDRSIADEIAQCSWKTPTACAAGIVDRVSLAVSGVEERAAALVAGVGRRLDNEQRRLDQRRLNVAVQSRISIDRSGVALSTRANRIAHRATTAVITANDQLNRDVARLAALSRRSVDHSLHRLELIDVSIAARDPRRLLAQGWAIAHDHDGRLLRSADQVNVGETVSITLSHGIVTTAVTDIEPTPVFAVPSHTSPDPASPDPTIPDSNRPDPNAASQGPPTT